MNALIPPHGEPALFLQKTRSLRVKTGAGTYDGWRARGLLRGPLVRSDPSRVYSQKAEGTPSFLYDDAFFAQRAICPRVRCLLRVCTLLVWSRFLEL